MSGPRPLTGLVVRVPVFALLCGAAPLTAQYQEAPPPPAYAVQGATVHHADGRAEAGVTLVVRDGLIRVLAAGADVPVDATLLEGDSLHVYPGLVDAHGQAAFEFPEEEHEEVLSWDAPRDVQGFTPHRQVSRYLTATGSDFEEHRQAGVVAMAVHPDGGLASGQGAVLVLRKGAAKPSELVAQSSVGLSMALKGARGAYPSQLFGVIAYIRQAFLDADRYGVIQAAYAEDPDGMTAPTWDPDYEVLEAVASGRMPVFFAVDGAEDIRRVMSLADQFGFRPVIVGGGEAWKVADDLRDRGVPVLVSLDFPPPADWEPEEEEEEEEEEAEETEAAPSADVEAPDAAQADPSHRVAAGNVRAEGPDQEEDPLTPAAAREKERLENLYANVGRLEAAGVSYALTSGGGAAALLEGARKAVAYGLAEDAAVRALTSAPATMLGIGETGRIGQGLAATFIVTDGPLLGEDTKILYTLVAGELERGKAPGSGDAPAVDVSGSWEGELESQMGGADLTMRLTQDPDGEFSGTLDVPAFGQMRVESGQVSGTDVTFTIVVNMGQPVELVLSGSVEGDRLRASGSGAFGAVSITARRGPQGGVR